MLSYNENLNTFLLTTKDDAAAAAAGLTRSTTARGPNGENVYFTADYDKKPVFNSYAALPFWREADERARAHLDDLVGDYESSWARESEFQVPAPAGKEYLPYQRAGIEYASKRDNTLIGDEPGLGKTVQAIGFANLVGAKRVLVLCPASIRPGWQREVHAWSTLPRVKTYPIMKSADGVNPLANYVICSYDLARSPGIHEALCSVEWDVLVLDEVHFLKSTTAKRTQAVFGGGAANSRFRKDDIARHSARIIGLTGTPLPNRPRECYTVTRALDHGAIDWMSDDAFEYRFNPPAAIGHKEKKGRLPELQARLRTNIMVRRLKKDVLPQLPDKRYEMAPIEPDGAILEILAKEALIDFDPRELFNPNFSLDGTPISTLRREMGEAKVPRALSYLHYILDVVEVEKLVVFAHHNSVMDAIVEEFGPRYGVSQSRGGMSTPQKDESKFEFIDGANRVYLGQLDTMEGVDGLQSVASHVVFVEPAWRPGTNEQCVDRCHRIGQHDNVIAQFLIVKGSLDDKVLSAVLNKAHHIHETLDNAF